VSSAEVTKRSSGLAGGIPLCPARQFLSKPQLGKTPADTLGRLVRMALAQPRQHESLQRPCRVQDKGELPRRRRLPPQLDEDPFGLGAGILSQCSHSRSIIPTVRAWEVRSVTRRPGCLPRGHPLTSIFPPKSPRRSGGVCRALVAFLKAHGHEDWSCREGWSRPAFPVWGGASP
jgi:hypothetical protein